jgi:hypothetical protein
LKNPLRLIILALLVVGGIWLWRTFFPSPERVITGNLKKLAHAASVHPGDGSLPRMLGAQSVGRLVADTVEIHIDVPGYHQQSVESREDIVQKLTAIKVSTSFTVDFPDINVTVSADGLSAQADVTVEIHASGEPDMAIQQMRVTLRKIDGHWLITKVQTVRTFSQREERLCAWPACVT